MLFRSFLDLPTNQHAQSSEAVFTQMLGPDRITSGNAVHFGDAVTGNGIGRDNDHDVSTDSMSRRRGTMRCVFAKGGLGLAIGPALGQKGENQDRQSKSSDR